MKPLSLGVPDLLIEGGEFRAGRDFPDGMVGDFDVVGFRET